MDRQTACLQGGRLWGECLSDQPSAGGSQAGLLHAVTTSMCATWRSQYSASPICAQAEMTAIAKLCDNYVAWQQPAICSQVGRRAGPVAVLRPPLKALALGRAVDVDGAPDAAAALVQPLSRRRVLLQGTRHHTWCHYAVRAHIGNNPASQSQQRNQSQQRWLLCTWRPGCPLMSYVDHVPMVPCQ